jgi:PTH1 family peptidyl-tRNA hydrolase
MKVIVGLGNPGHEYELTRHNAGFRLLEEVARHNTGSTAVGLFGITNGADWKIDKKLQAQINKTKLAGEDVVLTKPLTYMNLSGQAVLAVLNWFKVSAEDLLIVHDDVSLNLGRLRFQSGGGAGGQHGVESIIASLGGRKDFDRLKFGVGPDPGGDVRANYVLSRIPEVDRELFEKCLAVAREGLVSWVKNGMQRTMNTFNGRVIGIPFCLKQEESTTGDAKPDPASRERDFNSKPAAQDLIPDAQARDQLPKESPGNPPATDEQADDQTGGNAPAANANPDDRLDIAPAGDAQVDDQSGDNATEAPTKEPTEGDPPAAS